LKNSRVQSIYDIIAKVNADSEHQLNEVCYEKGKTNKGSQEYSNYDYNIQRSKRDRERE
jgi:hypothetical protein